MEQTEYRIFYSWQSDTDPRHNRYFIAECLDAAIKELNKEKDFEVKVVLDRDTLGATGSPDILESILNKIDACQILVADVTIINSDQVNSSINEKLVSNPNVMLELGYGLHRLSWDRIICLNNLTYSNIENLPFDIRQKRISTYRHGNSSQKSTEKKKLTALLRKAIQGIISTYATIESKYRSNNAMTHDTVVFKQVDEIIQDDKFISLLQAIANSQLLENVDYERFDAIEDFLRADSNKFLIKEIAESAQQLQESIRNMHMTFATNFHSKYESWIEEGEERSRTTYTFHEQLPNDRKEQKTEENITAIQEVVEKYRSFRRLVKEELFV